MATEARIYEHGNGHWPSGGDVLRGQDEELYVLNHTVGPIHTSPRAGEPNYIWADVTQLSREARDAFVMAWQLEAIELEPNKLLVTLPEEDEE